MSGAEETQGGKDELYAIRQAVNRILEVFTRRRQHPTTDSLMKAPPPEEDAVAFAHRSIPGSGARPLSDVLQESMSIFLQAVRQDDPRNFSMIPSVPTPISLVSDMLISIFNINMATWKRTPGPTAIETGIISWLASQAGFPSTAGGLFVSGGSIANLTCLMAARDIRLKIEDRARAVIYTSTQAHHSIYKALRVLGFTPNQVRKIPVDSQFRINMDVLLSTIAVDRSQGHLPFCIIATAGTTNTGSIDPLSSLAALAKTKNLWLHVDGAYGTSVILSKTHKHLLQGLEHADSISWDAHKWLFQTIACSLLLIRDKRHLLETFSETGDYMQDTVMSEAELETASPCDMGIEMTRPARAMKLWVCMQVYGRDGIAQKIDQAFVLSEAIAEELKDLEGWIITSGPSMGIITFRYAPSERPEYQDVGTQDQINKSISKRCMEDDVGQINTTQVAERTVLRMVTINPELSVEGVKEIVRKIDGIARSICGGI